MADESLLQDQETCNWLGQLLTYPRPGYYEKAAYTAQLLEAAAPPQPDCTSCSSAGGCAVPDMASLSKPQHPLTTADHLYRFATTIAAIPYEILEELYSRTFDLAPTCVPYVTVHLFGEESFKRAELMSGLAASYQRAGEDLGGELPDHLGVILRFAPQFSPEEWTDIRRFVLKVPVSRMLFVLERSGNPYSHLLAAVNRQLASDHNQQQPASESKPEESLCSTPSCSSACPTSQWPCSSADPFIVTVPTGTATPPCPLSSLRAAGCSGEPSPGM